MRNGLITATAVALALFWSASASAQPQMNYKDLYKNASPGVVLIACMGDGYGSTGTGSVVREDGLILTNAHVILDRGAPFKRVYVFLKPARVNGKPRNDLQHRYDAKLLSYSEPLDLALVQMINPPDSLQALPLADSSDIGIGEATVAIGHPEQGAKWTLTTGAISAEWDDFQKTKGKDVFQMQTPLNRGNSGGPLLDYRGYQIGVNTAIARKAEDGLAIVGVNFAVKANVAKKYIRDQGYEVVAPQKGAKNVTEQGPAYAEPPPPPPPPPPEPPKPATADDPPTEVVKAKPLPKKAPVRKKKFVAHKKGAKNSKPPGTQISEAELFKKVEKNMKKLGDDIANEIFGK